MRRIVGSLLVGAVVVPLLIVWRGFFWQHAVIIGLAMAALVYSGGGVWARLRSMYRRSSND